MAISPHCWVITNRAIEQYRDLMQARHDSSTLASRPSHEQARRMLHGEADRSTLLRQRTYSGEFRYQTESDLVLIVKHESRKHWVVTVHTPSIDLEQQRIRDERIAEAMNLNCTLPLKPATEKEAIRLLKLATREDRDELMQLREENATLRRRIAELDREEAEWLAANTAQERAV